MKPSYMQCMNVLHHAWEPIPVRGVYRSVPEDFIVEERLGFQPEGHGEHVFVFVQKRNLNTDQAARILARHAGTRSSSVGYAGLKDRNAVTRQHFTVHLPGAVNNTPDWSELNSDQLSVLSVSRHTRKLRRGGLAQNAFRLILRNVEGRKEDINSRLTLIRDAGVPNYFMQQRFGRDCNNLVRAENLLLQGARVRDRHKRGIYLSAARAWLFNLVLSSRVEMDTWSKGVNGDSFMLDQSRSCFHVDAIDSALRIRLDEQEIHPTGPLWGRGRSMVTDRVQQLEDAALAGWGQWKAGLERSGLEMGRRRLRAHVRNLEWSWVDNKTLELSFSLSPGSYATAVLAELGDISESAR